MALSGCTGVAGLLGAHVNAYSGKELPQAEVATLLPAGSGTGYAMLARVDGKRYGDEVLGYPDDVRVLPGEHHIEVRCNQGLNRAAQPEFKAQFVAGHFYNLLCHDLGNGSASAEAKDLGTVDPRKRASTAE